MRVISAAIIVSVVAVALCRADGPPTTPCEPDEHTLFLHHFDGAVAADFARGSAEPTNAPGQRQFVDGVFGQALVFTRTERQLSFATAGNYDPAQGTIEFFVREPDVGVGGFASNRGYWQTQGGEPLEQVRLVIGRGNFNSARTGTREGDLFADFMDGQLGLKAPAGDWSGEQWHHIAVLWGGGEARLLIDGVCVAKGSLPGLAAGAPVFEVGTNAFLFMDELRISDVMREELQVADTTTGPTQFRPLSEQPQAPPPEPPGLPVPTPRPPVVPIEPDVPNLFVDDWLIDSQSKLIRRLGQVTRHPDNPVISPEGAWEQTAAFPFSGGAYRLGPEDWVLFYNTYVRWARSVGGTNVCIARSTDGVHWRKPELELFAPFEATPNNVVLSRPMDNGTVIHDPDDPDPARRWKMAVYCTDDQGTGVYGYVSPDGEHWTRLPDILVANAGDRTSLWHDTRRGKYVLFTRYSPIFPGRHIFQSESDDFVTWTEPRMVLHWSSMDRVHGIQHYGAGGFVYGDCYVGFLEIFHVPYRRLDTQIICSRDGQAWQRVCEGEAFLPNGPEGAFDHFWAFPAGSPPIQVGDELWFYYAGRGHPHAGPAPPIWPGGREGEADRNSYWAATGLATMRLDGFAAMDASGETATLITVPLRFDEGARLLINADADNYPPESSWLRVGVLDRNMLPLEGFSADECDTMRVDATRHVASWDGRSDISALAGREVRLQFHLQNTRLYSFVVAGQ